MEPVGDGAYADRCRLVTELPGTMGVSKDRVANLSVRLPGESDDECTGGLQFRFLGDSDGEVPPLATPVRLRRAAEWALDLDSQYRELMQAGRPPTVPVPLVSRVGPGRVERDSLVDYRGLRLAVGELIRPVLADPPEQSNLYPFQRHGVEWLVGTRGGILADDMGLGKTVQVITAMRLLFNRAEIRTALVVCPKSLVANWERELERWAPELGTAVMVPPARIREEAWAAVASRRHVLLTNYEQLRDPPDILVRAPPDLIVADEAHRLRNYGSRASAGAFRLRPLRFWAITGTPLERNLEDFATLLSLVAPQSFAPSDARQHPSSLRSQARAFVLRRRKQEVLSDLPPVRDVTEALDLLDGQARAYRAAVRHYRRGGKGKELALLTRLQALCDIEPEHRSSSKLDRVVALLEGVRENSERAVVFSYRLDPLRELQRRITERWGADAAVLLLGAMDAQEREHAIARLRRGERTLALLASSRVGSEGLTLVEANHVFLLNQWWNPSANDQARDRVVRIGQRRQVSIYRFCCRNTIEEALAKILQSKRELFDAAVDRLATDDATLWSAVLREAGMDRLLATDTEQH